MTRTSPDVLVIGAGPVGLTAALLLAGHGLCVTLLERRRQLATEPRAVALDDEGLRIWQSCGLHETLREDWAGGDEGQCICSYLDERDRPFLRLHQRTSALGHPHAVAIHQGRIEAKLLRAVEEHPAIRVLPGHTVERIDDIGGGVRVVGIDHAGQAFSWEAPWAIACDGGASCVRRGLGIEMVGDEVRRPWLVANVVDQGEPDHVLIRCRSDGASVTMPLPHGLRRVEVELDEADDGAWMGDASEVRRRLSRGWAGAATAPIVTAARCRFRAMIASRWRAGRIFLAGDAAHVTPPFAGQGLGAGLRDVANLSFKIAGVAQGWLAPATLDTYEAERRPHVQRMTRLACRLGRLMSPRSPAASSLLQAALRLVSAAPSLGGRWMLRGPSIEPRLTEGFLVPTGEAGRYLPQPTVLAPDQRRVPLDDLLGPRMTWIRLGDDSRPGSRTHRERPPLQPPLLQPSDSMLIEGRDFHDPDQALRARYGPASLLLVRPDRVVHSHITVARSRTASLRRLACHPQLGAARSSRDALVPRLSA